ncbi:MAG: divisome-associated lipoprotein YraP [Tolumonas sp.]|jgi:osmotically-inducible protein OsmY|uniref:division/outer membrane stress-associated lipid-binding lipoprotein n=1 Tax=Tolumonas auensis TaxID=43948 RepID=UPI001B6AA4D9|nr:division/outer membrane stress-associated lipid-binding lipoprotein [Tolumonas auensis]MBP7980347.1 divisome-associated lipoprotein YraP [Tolumonas sp.]
MLRKLLPLSLASLLLLQGCVGVLLAGGAASGVVVAKDRRSVTAQMDDQKIELNTRNELSDRTDISRISHISINSNNGIVLLVGQTPYRKHSDEVKAMAERQNGVRKVYNEIKITEPTGYDIRTNDSWITSKVRTRLIAEKNFDSSHIKVVTEDSQVFLMGMVTRDEGELAVEIARNVSGVTKVIRVFEYVQQ